EQAAGAARHDDARRRQPERRHLRRLDHVARRHRRRHSRRAHGARPRGDRRREGVHLQAAGAGRRRAFLLYRPGEDRGHLDHRHRRGVRRAPALGAAVLRGLGGFGTGVILAAALVPLIGVKALVPVLAVAGVIINAGRFWFYRAHVERAALTVMLAAALPFLVLGAWLYSVLD